MQVVYVFGRIPIGPWPSAWAPPLNRSITIVAAALLAAGVWAWAAQPLRLIDVLLLMVLIEGAAASFVIYLHLRQMPGDGSPPLAPGAGPSAEPCMGAVRWWPFELALAAVAVLMHLPLSHI